MIWRLKEQYAVRQETPLNVVVSICLCWWNEIDLKRLLYLNFLYLRVTRNKLLWSMNRQDTARTRLQEWSKVNSNETSRRSSRCSSTTAWPLTLLFPVSYAEGSKKACEYWHIHWGLSMISRKHTHCWLHSVCCLRDTPLIDGEGRKRMMNRASLLWSPPRRTPAKACFLKDIKMKIYHKTTLFHSSISYLDHIISVRYL